MLRRFRLVTRLASLVTLIAAAGLVAAGHRTAAAPVGAFAVVLALTGIATQLSNQERRTAHPSPSLFGALAFVSILAGVAMIALFAFFVSQPDLGVARVALAVVTAVAFLGCALFTFISVAALVRILRHPHEHIS